MSALQDLYANDNTSQGPAQSQTLTPLQALYAADNTSGSGSWQDFTQQGKQAAKQAGFPSEVLLGQAALESARGTAAPGNNYFGIKGSGDAGSNNLATKEYGANGYYGENDNFGAYSSPKASIQRYLNLVMSYPGVPQAVATGDKMAVLKAIKAAGYATSPTYVQDVANTPEFQGGN